MSWGRFNLHPGPTRQGMRRFSTQKPAPCTVVVIDGDDDDDGASDSEVYIIDDGAAAGEAARAAPGCQTKKGDGSSGNVINIDDDEDVEEGTGRDKAGPSTSRASGSPASMTPGRGSPRNRYGLDCTSDSSDSDSSEEWASDTDDGSSSDCEILDDTAGTREMWETAASRKKVPHGVHERKDGRATAFTSCAGSETQPDKDAEGLFGADCHLDENIFQFFSAACKEDAQNSTGCAKNSPSECHLNENFFRYFSDAWKERAQSSAGSSKDVHGPSSAPNAKECSNGNVSNGKETECVQNINGDAKDGPAECHLNENIYQHYSDASQEGVRNNIGSAKDGHGPSSALNAKDCSNGKDGVVPEKASEGVQSPCPDETFVYNFVSANRVFPGGSSADRKDGSPPIFVSTPEKIDEKIPEGVYSQKDQSPTDAHNNKDMYAAQDASDFQDLLIGEREKHKESVEYKRAAEAEWASRQRQLQIQAEEAKKLRKRKKAEAQRLLDMEKRQKQRLQEVRDSQRKNEEAIQLKEQYRGVVRKELEDMERRYRDMISILRALGIPVEGSEVKTAYKQALLKFHPDRVSRNDIYQQVKAEETFKFISRLKEKLPLFP